MSKKHRLWMILLIVGILSPIGFTSEEPALKFSVQTLTLNGVTFNNDALESPLVFMDDTLYYPLTESSAKAIGFDLKRRNSGDLYLLPRTSFSAKDLLNFDLENKQRSQVLSQMNVTVYAYGYPIVSNKALLMLGETVYISLQDTPALLHNLISDSLIDVQIAINNSLSKLPKSYSVYNTLDSSQLLRNQGNAATCWAYAANALFEIAIAKDTGIYENFSESHMLANAPIPVTYESGGHFGISSMYYLNQMGPKNLEDQFPFRLLSYEEINNNLFRTKKAIFNYGAVLSSIHLNDYDKNIYNAISGAYFNPYTNKARSHELILVGWDDSYSRENFSTPPSRDGAFIAQNSFGNQWGKEGFLYISYDDVHILTEVYALSQYKRSENHDKLYYHDKTGTTHFETVEGYQSPIGINVFKTGNSSEDLANVAFKTAEDHVNVEIFYGLLADGFTLESPLLTQEIPYKGFHTFDFTEQNTIPANTAFWIAIKFSGTSQFQVPIESPYPGIGYAINANKGESYIGDGTTFIDLTEIRDKANVAIRVTTRLPN